MPKHPNVDVPKLDIGEICDVMVLTTAQKHYSEIQRLPNRRHQGRTVAAFQVQTRSQAERILKTFDEPQTTIYLDVERKVPFDLLEIAYSYVRSATIETIKPNDITVDASMALIQNHFGYDLRDLVCTVIGTGNIGFKIAIRLAESGAAVGLHGRNKSKATLLTDAANSVTPRHTRHKMVASSLANSRLMVSAVGAQHVILREHLNLLDSVNSTLCVDVGIGTLSPDFIEAAVSSGHPCVRLDVRSAGNPLPVHPNPFFIDVAGHRIISGTRVVAGGLIGARGEVVVDEIRTPHQVLGIANGVGGLVSSDDWTTTEVQAVEQIRLSIQTEHKSVDRT